MTSTRRSEVTFTVLLILLCLLAALGIVTVMTVTPGSVIVG